MSTYALSNSSVHGVSHLDGLSGMYDPFTTARIAESTRLFGARCLEIGAGNGSIACWLAERVGPEGMVLALDLDPTRIPEHRYLSTQMRDLTRDPLPAGPFHLIHGRLILGHLPNRDTLLPQLCGLLAPGGTILVEEFHLPPGHLGDQVRSVPAATPQVRHLWERYLTYRGELFTAAGSDGTFADRMDRVLEDEGLVDVRTVTWCTSFRGGDPGAFHALGGLEQFRPQLAERGFGDAEVDALVEALNHPDFRLSGRALTSTSGRRPA